MLLAIITVTSIAFAQGLVIKPGTKLTTIGNVSVVIANGSFINNGSSNLGSADVYLTGSGAETIGGLNTTFILNKLILNRKASTVALGGNVTIKNAVIFTSGMLNLNSNNLVLAAPATLTGESETSRIIGPTGGEVITTVNLNAPASVNPGNIGAVIASTANLGSVKIARGHKVASVASNNSINRYYTITPLNNTSLNATVKFTYFDAELNSIAESDLKIFSSSNSGTSWTALTTAAASSSLNYVQVNALSSLYRYTLSKSTTTSIATQRTAQEIPFITNEKVDPVLKISVYPNPVTDVLKAAITVNNPTAGSIVIYSVSGQLMQSKSLQLSSGYNLIELNLLGHAIGIYKIALVLKDGERKLMQVVKQ